ncbi:protein translocase subunit SecF [Chloroflexota bacterium]
MLNIIGNRFRYLWVAGILTLLCIVFLALFGLELGIDFSSGSILTATFEQEVDQGELEEELAALGYTSATVERNPQGDLLIRTVELNAAEKSELKDNLAAKFGAINEKGFENVDPVIAKETARVAGIAVAVAAVGIILYIIWAFRRMPSPFLYGICGFIALVFNVLVVLGVFSVLGALLSWEINLMFITGILAVIGYSVNNMVVIFDRIRENLRRGVSPQFGVVVNSSLVESLGRSFNTSLTTLLVILALLLFVGSSIQNFAIVLLIGILVGTYSSLYVAPLLVVVWERGEWGRFFRTGVSG